MKECPTQKLVITCCCVVALGLVNLFFEETISGYTADILEEHLIAEYLETAEHGNGQFLKVSTISAQKALPGNLKVEFENFDSHTPFIGQGITKTRGHKYVNFDYSVTSNGVTLYSETNVYKRIHSRTDRVYDSSAFSYYINYLR